MSSRPIAYFVGDRKWCYEALAACRGVKTFVAYDRLYNIPFSWTGHVFVTHFSSRIDTREVAPKAKWIGFHLGDLPKGRGGSPLQNLRVRGVTETLLTAFQMTDKFDAGPIYLKRSIYIGGAAEEVYVRAMRLAGEMASEIVKRNLKPKPQVGKATVFKRRTPAESFLDLSATKDLDTVHNFVSMLDAEGYPQAFVDVGPYRLYFSRSSRRAGHIKADVKICKIA